MKSLFSAWIRNSMYWKKPCCCNRQRTLKNLWKTLFSDSDSLTFKIACILNQNYSCKIICIFYIFCFVCFQLCVCACVFFFFFTCVCVCLCVFIWVCLCICVWKVFVFICLFVFIYCWVFLVWGGESGLFLFSYFSFVMMVVGYIIIKFVFKLRPQRGTGLNWVLQSSLRFKLPFTNL